MSGKVARALRKRAIINPKEGTINRKLYKKMKKEYKRNATV